MPNLSLFDSLIHNAKSCRISPNVPKYELNVNKTRPEHGLFMFFFYAMI